MVEKIDKCCDLVMKGGVTSGVVYPAAINEIAKKFYLMSIGGTSAGAIAACVAAAAEYRRRETGSSAGFDLLEKVAQDLKLDGKLESLFRPDKPTAKLFNIAIKFLDKRASWITKAHLYLKREKFSKILRENGYGLCSGLANDYSVTGKPALTHWLADLIDEVAGKKGSPLTFGDLHAAKIPDELIPKADAMKGRAIDLRLVTTCLTLGRPFEIPLSQNIFAFDPVEWSRIFPPKIIDHLRSAAGKIKSTLLRQDGKLPLPRDELPIVVAARMSLSFPVLFSMVPLWSPNFDKEGKPLERVWFSDGGITSNFPMHRFDTLYPSWPTLGINLQYTDKSGYVQRSRVQKAGEKIFIPKDRKEGLLGIWNDFAGGDSALTDLFGFGGAIFRSAQTWHDNAFLRLPGYRDRIAEIWLTDKEGGLNLNMEPVVIDELIKRGREAGRALASKFAGLPQNDPMSWAGHRWTRFRSGMAGMVEALNELKQTAIEDPEGRAMLKGLLASISAPPCYQFNSQNQYNDATVALDILLKCIEDLDQLVKNYGLTQKEKKFGVFFDGPRPAVNVGTRAPI